MCIDVGFNSAEFFFLFISLFFLFLFCARVHMMLEYVEHTTHAYTSKTGKSFYVYITHRQIQSEKSKSYKAVVPCNDGNKWKNILIEFCSCEKIISCSLDAEIPSCFHRHHHHHRHHKILWKLKSIWLPTYSVQNTNVERYWMSLYTNIRRVQA